MKIIDTHQHLWDLELFPYSWTESLPAIHRSYRMDDYQRAWREACAAPGPPSDPVLELEQSVHVEADVDESFQLQETQHVLRIAARADNPMTGVVAACRPESPEFPHALEQIAADPCLKGLRRILHTQPDEISQTLLFTENVRRLGALGLTFDLCVLSRQLPLALRLIRACPDVSFVLDHCGNPRVSEGEVEPWRSSLRAVAKLPNVVCKISGIVVNAHHDRWTASDLRPSIETVIELFGWDRVLFGSDWPVCTLAAHPRQWLHALLQVVDAASPQQKSALFRENARRVYRLP